MGLTLMVVGDVLTSFAYNLNLPFWNIGVFIKVPLQILFLVILFRFKRFHYLYVVLLVLLLCWFTGTMVSSLHRTNASDNHFLANFIVADASENYWAASLTVVSRYLLFFSVLPMLLLHCDDDVFLKKCQGLFEYFLYANCVAIIAGFIFHIPFFSSYNPQAEELVYESRFGYKGLLFGINETTGVFFLGLAHVYREIFFFRRKKYFLLFLLLVGSALTGAKGCIIASALVSSYYLFQYRRILFLATAAPVVVALVVYLIKIDFVEQVRSFFNIYLGDDFSSTPLGAVVTLLMTGRNIYIYNNWQYMLQHWGLLNYFFGDGLLYSETDLMDLYYCFGIGTIVYLFAYLKLIFYKSAKYRLTAVILLLFLLAFTGGHILRSAVFPIFFSLYLIVGYRTKEKQSRPVDPIQLQPA
ncbi:hypothetical protein GCM10023229_20960 [Flavisolibacter ginsenosidimutans]